MNMMKSETSRIVFIKRANCAEELLLMIMMMQMSLVLVQLKIIELTKLRLVHDCG